MGKIVFFLPNLEGGGSERVALNFIEQLDKNIFDVYLIIGIKRGELTDLLPDRIKVIELNVKKILLSFYPFYRQCKKIEPDIIFSTLNRTNIVAILTGFFLNKTKIIIREPNLPSNQIQLLPKFTLTLVKFFYPKADYIIAQTPEMRNEMIDHYRLDPLKIQVLENPINKNMIDKCVNNTKTPFDENKINIVAIGSLIYRKGFDLLIESFKEVVSRYDNANLYILGKGRDEKKLNQQVKKLDLLNEIHFLGYQDNPYKYLNYADIYVMSSRAEGLPNTVLESLYLKTKVVVTDCVPFVSNMIKDNNLGEVVKVDDINDLSSKIQRAVQRKDYSFREKFNSFDYNAYFKAIIYDY